MAKIRITQVRSRIHCTKRQKLNLDALGLKKMNATVEHEATPQIKGMVNQVKHLLQVTEI
jgi:large subunit ribosomal protein L30